MTSKTSPLTYPGHGFCTYISSSKHVKGSTKPIIRKIVPRNTCGYSELCYFVPGKNGVYYRLVSASLASHDLRPQTTFNGSHLLKSLLSSRGLLRFYHRDSHCICSASVLT